LIVERTRFHRKNRAPLSNRDIVPAKCQEVSGTNFPLNFPLSTPAPCPEHKAAVSHVVAPIKDRISSASISCFSFCFRDF
jgi:hypothetical protein